MSTVRVLTAAGPCCARQPRIAFPQKIARRPTLTTAARLTTTVVPEFRGECQMAWKKPKIVEIPVGAEINTYAAAELKK